MIGEMRVENGILKACTQKEAFVEVPVGVHTIGEGAFKGCVSIEQILLPDTLEHIGTAAFKGCRRLKEINLPPALKEIGDYAFHRCHSLRRAELPPSVEELGSCVFLYCDKLESVTMPGVKKLGGQVFLNDVSLKRIVLSPELDLECICDVFTGCGNLTEIGFSDGRVIPVIERIAILSGRVRVPLLVRVVVKDIYRMMEIEESTVVRFLTNLRQVELPEGITAIGNSCFFDKKGIVSVKLPSTLQVIGSRAFRNCINLLRVEFQGEGVEIHEDAFKNCTTLRYIGLPCGAEHELAGLAGLSKDAVPPIVRTIQEQVLGNFHLIGTTLFAYRGMEERVVVPDGVTVIGKRAFAGNEAVDRVILPDSVKEIEEEAFQGCLLLQTVQFPESLYSLGNAAFENCVKLIRAVLPESLKELPASAFQRCRLLKEVRLGSRVRQIGELAFYGCTSLKNLLLPESLISIGTLAFYRCHALKEIKLPKALKYLGNNVFTQSGVTVAELSSRLEYCGSDVFSECMGLRRLNIKEGAIIIGDRFAYQCEKLRQVELPQSLLNIGRGAFLGSAYLSGLKDGRAGGWLISGDQWKGAVVLQKGIEGIAGGAFYGNKELTSVVIPESVRWIGPRAFCGCTSLKHVVLPSSIDELPEGVFAYCTSLLQVEARGTIRLVLNHAFYGCSKLNKLQGFTGTQSIGKAAFCGCSALMELDAGFSKAGDRAFYGTGFLKLKMQGNPAIFSGLVIDGSLCKGDVVLPDGITRILPYAFCGNDRIERLVCPKSLLEVMEYSFAGCKNLREVSFPDSPVLLGDRAFEKCISLKKIKIHTAKINNGAFAWCEGLKEGVVAGLKRIGEEAFLGCKTLQSFRFAEGLNEGSTLREEGQALSRCAEVAKEAFSGCLSLESFDFSMVTVIKPQAFSGCTALKALVLNDGIAIGDSAFEDCGRLKEIELLGGGCKLHSHSFFGCTRLQTVMFEGISYILTGYANLFDHRLPDMVKAIYGSALSCFTIDEHNSLRSCRSTGSILSVPEGVKRIEAEVFRDFIRLKELTIPESVSDIGARAFWGTSWLEDKKAKNPIIVQNKILIDATACSGEVRVPADVKIVSGWAFAGCSALTGVIFSSSFTLVEEYAFRNCFNLKRVVTADHQEYRLNKLSDLNAKLPEMVRQIFRDCYHCFKMGEGGRLVESTGNITKLRLPEGVCEIGEEVFQDSNLLTEISLTKGTVKIGKNAFKDCKWLESVNLAEAVEEIGDSAFSGCIRLLEVSELKRLQILGKRAFENCTALKQIWIPEGIFRIPERAFYRCHSLKKVVLPHSLKWIDREAFAFCYELLEVVFQDSRIQIGERAFFGCSELRKL